MLYFHWSPLAVLLQLVIIVGGGLARLLGSPVAALVLLVLLKTAGDIFSLAYRKRYGGPFKEYARAGCRQMVFIACYVISDIYCRGAQG